MARKPKSTTASGATANGGDDDALWGQVAGSVTPLKRRPGTEAKTPDTPKQEAPAKAAKKSLSKQPAAARTAAPIRPAAPPLSAGAGVGMDKRTAQRLRRGQIAIEGRIDLHGMTQAEAHANLVRFLQGSAAAGRRCVLVITGKGMRGGAGTGVLREQFPRWLNEAGLRPLVLGFAAAQPKDGGGGAFYVYLRKAPAP